LLYSNCSILTVLSIHRMQFRNYSAAAAALFSTSKLFQQPLYTLNQTSTSSYHTMPRAPATSVCHGGGPMSIMNDPGHAALIKSMTTKAPQVLGLGTSSAPRAIVLVIATYSERRPTISNGKKHQVVLRWQGRCTRCCRRLV
jgi:hypothetical protein